MSENDDEIPLPKRRAGATPPPPADAKDDRPQMRYGRTYLGLGANLFQAVVVMFCVVISVPIALFLRIPCLFALVISLVAGIIVSGLLILIFRAIADRQSRRRTDNPEH